MIPTFFEKKVAKKLQKRQRNQKAKVNAKKKAVK